jgi:RNA polymerase sigma-70 factor (ECF subfamily)
VTAKIDLAELNEHRPYLLKFAMLQVRDTHLAEELVQDAFLAALTAAERFAGGSSVRTWLTSILLHKIADHRRKAGREISIEAHQGENGSDGIEALFQENGRYVEMPELWRTPEQALTERRFFEVLEHCIQGLSETAARVFLLRELMGLGIQEICNELSVSATNCSVHLHRARMRLRACLEKRWFAA